MVYTSQSETNFFDCFLCEVKKVKITFLKLPDFMSQNIQLK